MDGADALVLTSDIRWGLLEPCPELSLTAGARVCVCVFCMSRVAFLARIITILLANLFIFAGRKKR